MSKAVVTRGLHAVFFALSAFGNLAAQTHDALSEADLVGLWGEKRIIGPELRGTLTVECDASGGRAEIGGRRADVRHQSNEISFELPEGQGRFRGRIDGGQIIGHWIQPRTIAYGTIFASPVRLLPIGKNLWQGDVNPLDDAMTFYLMINHDRDSNLTAYFCNPERNAGRFMTVERISIASSTVSFLSKDDEILAEGRYSAEDECLSIFLPWAGGTYDFSKYTAAQLGGFYPRGKHAEVYEYHPPLPQPDGWIVASLEDVEISRDSIVRFVQMLMDMPMESGHSLDLHGVLIARQGKLVLEEYFHGYNRNELHDTRSASKTLTSTLLGAAILGGYKVSESTPVYETMLGVDSIQTIDPLKQAMTLEHLLTMSSGLDCDDSDSDSPGNEDNMQEQLDQPDWIQYTIDLNIVREPGEKSVYCSCNPNLLGGVLAKTTRTWLPTLFDELIAGPMQFGHYALNLMPNREAYMGGGARLLPRDFMKLGQMMLDGGRWNGTQIVSSAWAKRATSPLVELEDHGYGYYWWNVNYPYKGDSVSAFFAGGNGGQIVMGVPQLDLVIAFYGGNYSDVVFLTPQRVFVPVYILPAVDSK